MAEWTEGYVSGIDYNYDTYPELNPHRARLPFLSTGIALPARFETACELGFGFGVSPNVHAAAGGTEWWGTDFNPAQAAFARELARETGADAHLFDEPFAEFCNRSDLPDFDFVGLHGVWTWVSEANRATILDFLRRRLKPGGVVYASYNTLPGWSQIVPLRKLLTDHAERASPAAAPIAARIDAAVAYADALVAASPRFAELYPLLTGRLKALPGYGKSYVAHEYFNRDWEPMLFSEINGRMEGAKLSFACSADMPHHFDRHNLSAAQVEFLKGAPDRTMRESSRDLMINRQFRKDYWVKGERRLDQAAQLAALKAHRLILVADPEAVSGAVDGALVGRFLDEAVVKEFVAGLADREERTLGEVAEAMAPSGATFAQALEAAMILTGRGDAASVVEASEATRASALRFNRALLKRAEYGQPLGSLASPVTGGALTTAHLHQKFLLARERGLTAPAEWAGAVWEEYRERGTRVVRGGKVLETDRENIDALIGEAESFAGARLPVLTTLGAVQ